MKWDKGCTNEIPDLAAEESFSRKDPLESTGLLEHRHGRQATPPTGPVQPEFQAATGGRLRGWWPCGGVLVQHSPPFTFVSLCTPRTPHFGSSQTSDLPVTGRRGRIWGRRCRKGKVTASSPRSGLGTGQTTLWGGRQHKSQVQGHRAAKDASPAHEPQRKSAVQFSPNCQSSFIAPIQLGPGYWGP